MNYKKDKNYRLTVRLNNDQYSWLSEKAKETKVNVSECIRNLLSTIQTKEHKK